MRLGHSRDTGNGGGLGFHRSFRPDRPARTSILCSRARKTTARRTSCADRWVLDASIPSEVHT